eukprot:m.244454 g.244454  ORF g.244454 m.244454 type:complete len:50 (-) comp26623_c1_seq9:121-270(-)
MILLLTKTIERERGTDENEEKVNKVLAECRRCVQCYIKVVSTFSLAPCR